jgi:hypothetical protein
MDFTNIAQNSTEIVVLESLYTDPERLIAGLIITIVSTRYISTLNSLLLYLLPFIIYPSTLLLFYLLLFTPYFLSYVLHPQKGTGRAGPGSKGQN